MVDRRPINCALIDLDDCLYRVPEMTQQVRENIERYIQERLDVPKDQVSALTLELYYGYGTTLAGLLARGYEIDVDDFHHSVHGTLDYAGLLRPDPVVRDVILSMDCPRYILTNADHKHAMECLQRLGIADCFNGIFDYEAVQELARSKGLLTMELPLLCKPSPKVYEIVISAVGGEPSTTLFCDDSVRNVASAHELGILSVLVGKDGHVSGADASIASFAALPTAVPQLFQGRRQAEERQRRGSLQGDEAAASVTIRVPA